MSTPPANRMELLRTKKKTRIATRGHELLEKKRDALIQEYVTYVREYKKRSKNTLEQLQQAYKQLHVAQAVSGVHRVKSLGFATNKSLEAIHEEKNIMGVRVQTIRVNKLPFKHNASLIGTSYYVTQAQEQFQEVVPELVKLAELEKIIFALAEEIKKTKRRVNALEHIHIPRLEETKKHIQARLAEMEREEFVRLKHLKEHGS